MVVQDLVKRIFCTNLLMSPFVYYDRLDMNNNKIINLATDEGDILSAANVRFVKSNQSRFDYFID